MSNDIYNVDADMDQQSANNTVTSLQRNNIVNNDMNMDDDDMNMDDMSMDDDDMKMDDMEDMDDDDMEDMDDDDMDDDDAENEAGPLTESASLVRLYMGVFDRTPDSEGYKYWAEQMDSGVDLSSIADSFTSSAEFTEKFAGKDDEGFITSLYQNILNREADGAGLDWWTNQLTSGAMDKSDVVLSFTESPEYIANTDSAASNFFASLSGEDDSENMDDDDMENMDDDDMENMDDDDMENMDDDDMEDMDDDDMEDMDDDDMEDMGDDDMDDDDMDDMGANLDSSLVRLYMAVFDRAPDADGFKYWSGEMKQGSDLESIATSFLGSDEFESKYGGQGDESFVNNLYQNVLDRDADSAGLEWWVNELSSEGTDHSDVVLGFSESEEYAQNSEETVNNFLSSLNNSNDTLL